MSGTAALTFVRSAALLKTRAQSSVASVGATVVWKTSPGGVATECDDVLGGAGRGELRRCVVR